MLIYIPLDMGQPSNLEAIAFYREKRKYIRPVCSHYLEQDNQIKGNRYLKGLSACREVQILREFIKVQNTPLAIDYQPPEDLGYLILFLQTQLEAKKFRLEHEHRLYQQSWNKEKEIWPFLENSEAFFLAPYPTSLKIELREADLNELKKDFSTEFPLILMEEIRFFCYSYVSLKHTIKKKQTHDAANFITKALEEHLYPLSSEEEYDLSEVLYSLSLAIDCLTEASEALRLDDDHWVKLKVLMTQSLIRIEFFALKKLPPMAFFEAQKTLENEIYSSLESENIEFEQISIGQEERDSDS